ncbi:MAG: BMP family ABC transporter substrate-binding protein [Micrococcales bacterium]|nr:BMP family ABC transporter substrate-binding protein [Micrococcales bacterium]
MRSSTSRLGAIALGTAGVLALAGCGATPEDGDSAGPVASDFLPCIVSDSGGYNDHSFNDSGLLGITNAADELGVKFTKIESTSDDDYTPNIDAAISAGCTLVVTIGFRLSDATLEAAKANPDVQFAIVDDGLDKDGDGKPDVPNGKPIVFDTAQASFLAGYAAADTSKTGVVGTFGGMQIPPVTLFMDGFVDGVAYYNEEKGASVKAIGWDKASQTGVFTGGFAAGVDAKTAAQNLLDQNADVLLPVGGPIYQSAGEAIRDRGGDIALIGVDADVYETDPSVKELLLTSVMKGVAAGVHDVVVAASKGEFDNTPFIGTLANDGIGIAPFHDWSSKVKSTLQGDLDAVKAKIVSGELEITSQSTPR